MGKARWAFAGTKWKTSMVRNVVDGRGGQIVRIRAAPRPRFEISVCAVLRLRGGRPRRTASAKKFCDSAIFRVIFRVIRMIFCVIRAFFHVIRIFSALSAFCPRLSACRKTYENLTYKMF